MNNKAIAALAAAGGAAGGVAVGLLLRQPEINKLQKQVKVLQGRLDEMETLVAKQNADIARLVVQYESLKVFQFLKRKQLSGEIKNLLSEQYAAADYISLLIGRIKGGPELTDDEIRFYDSYKKMIEDKKLSDKDREVIDAFVLEHHGEQINRLEQCDIQSVFDELRDYGKDKEKKHWLPFLNKKEE